MSESEKGEEREIKYTERNSKVHPKPHPDHTLTSWYLHRTGNVINLIGELLVLQGGQEISKERWIAKSNIKYPSYLGSNLVLVLELSLQLLLVYLQ